MRKDNSLQILVRDNNIEQALKALKRKLQREGVFREMKRRAEYEKPSEKRARERAEAIRRVRKLARKQAQREGLLPAPKRKPMMPPTPGGAERVLIAARTAGLHRFDLKGAARAAPFVVRGLTSWSSGNLRAAQTLMKCRAMLDVPAARVQIVRRERPLGRGPMRTGRMADNSEAARLRAEARFEKLQKTTQENAAVWAQYEASCAAVRDRTTSLRELRLAKEAQEAEAAAAAALEKAASKKKRKVAVKA